MSMMAFMFFLLMAMPVIGMAVVALNSINGAW